jgi:hypothetical protein
MVEQERAKERRREGNMVWKGEEIKDSLCVQESRES